MKVELELPVGGVEKDRNGVVHGYYCQIFDHEGRKTRIYVPRRREDLDRDRARAERERVFRIAKIAS